MSDDKNFEEAAQNELNKKEEDGGLFEKAADDKAKETPVESGKAKKTNLGKSSDWKKKNPEETVSGEYKMGWHNLDPRSFPSKGLFYPEEMKIQIKDRVKLVEKKIKMTKVLLSNFIREKMEK